VVNSSFTGATEEYDGTTWTTSPSLNTARDQFSRSRNTNSSFSFWWDTPPATTAATEEWTGAGAAVTKTITVS
jgi:hypothetical protein